MAEASRWRFGPVSGILETPHQMASEEDQQAMQPNRFELE
jgi:hypothetical protein